MIMQVAIDSSLLVGLLVPNDLWHDRAVALCRHVEKAKGVSIYFDCVVAEAVSVATRRLHEKKLSEDITDLFDALDLYVPGSSLTWILPDVQRLYPDVLNLMRSSEGALNFNDALIALACRERQIQAIASFDADFDSIPWLKRLSRPEDLNLFENAESENG